MKFNSIHYRACSTILIVLITPIASWSLYNTAHCLDTPVVTLAFPQNGVCVQTTCYEGIVPCKVDTYYEDTLKADIHAEYQNKINAIFAVVTKVNFVITADTTWYTPDNFKVDTNQHETIWLKPIEILKGEFPETTVVFKESWLYIPEGPEKTYAALLDTPIVIFFDTLGYLSYDLGVLPLDECYFEPTAYMITDRGIVKRGRTRMARVYYSAREFLDAIGKEHVEVPQIFSIAEPDRNVQLSWDNYGLRFKGITPVYGVQLYNLKGHQVLRTTANSGNPLTVSSGQVPQGLYYLKISGEGWEWSDMFYMGSPTDQNKLIIRP